MEDFCVQTKRFAKGDLLRSERSSFGAQYAVFCDLKCRVLERLRHCADTLIIYYDCIYPPACRKGRGKSGCLQYVKHWIMRDLTGFIGILLPTCMLRVIDTKHKSRYLLSQAATQCLPPKRGLLALRFTQQSANYPHLRRYLDDIVHLMPVLFN